jgi:cobalt-zinc-cadmium efflux system outer membrane protein
MPCAFSATVLVFPAVAQTSRPILNVDSVISMVSRSNPRIGAAFEASQAARGARRTAGAWTNPTFTYQVENAGFPGQDSPRGLDKETSAFAMLPLEPAYQLRPRIARASAEVRAADADLRTTRRDITLQAVAAFYSTALAQVEVAGLADNRAWLDSLIRYAGARVKEGAAAEVDLIRLEVERDRAETDLALARVVLARSRSMLASLIGSNDFEIDVATAARPEMPRRSIPDLAVALATAGRVRPEIAAAQARLDAASSGVSVQRSSIVRDIGLMTGAKSTEGIRSMLAGVSFSLPLFDQNRGEIQRAEAERRIALADRESAERMVTADVTATFAAVETLSAQLARMQDGLIRRAEEARRVAEGAYREGATPLTQVIDAARALAEARKLYYRALFARAQAVIELNSSLEGMDSNQPPLSDRSVR